MDKKIITISSLVFAFVFVVTMSILLTTVVFNTQGTHNKLIDTLENTSQLNIMLYDEGIFSGKEVRNTIELINGTASSSDLSLEVDVYTKSGIPARYGTAYAYVRNKRDNFNSYTETKATEDEYINPKSTFKSHLVYNKNNVLIAIVFIQDGNTVAEYNLHPSNNLTVTASHTDSYVTVTFETNGGSLANTSIQFVVGLEYGSLPVPTKDGYTFDGWYTSASGGTKVDSSTKSSSSVIKLYARWSAESHTVTFNPNGGAVSQSSKSVTTGQKYGDLPTPTKAGSTFSGWYTSSTGGTLVDKNTVSTLFQDQTLYAHWNDGTHIITFDSNGGTPSSLPTKSLVVGQTYGALPRVTRDGYVFNGWYTSKTGGDKISVTSVFNGSGNQTLYARWSGQGYTLTYNLNGGGTVSSSYKTVYNGSTYGELPTPTRQSYTFQGWFTAPTGGTKVNSTDTVNLTSDQMVYAHWLGDEHTVSFDSNGGNAVSPANKAVRTGVAYGTLPTPTRNGYDFTGWFTSPTNGDKIISTTVSSLTADQTLYAHWTGKTYTVNFDANGGSVTPTSKQVQTFTQYGELPIPKRTGYEFDGWFTSRVGGTRVRATTVSNLTNNQTLYAHWTGEKHTVTFDSTGGSNANPGSKFLQNGTTYGTLPTVTKDNYDFQGWFIQRTGGTQILSSTILALETDQILYAHWRGKEVMVTLNANGGSVTPTSIKPRFTETYGTIPTPTRDHYDFLGWYSSQSAGSKITSTTSVTLPTNHSIYAHWRGKPHTITFDTNKGTGTTNPNPSTISSITVYYGEKYVGLPTTISRTGYRFDGWQTSATGGTVITGNTTVTLGDGVSQSLYAKWIANTYTLSFNTNITPSNTNGPLEGTAPSNRTVTFDQAYGTLPVLSRTGYTFDGWFNQASGGTKILDTTKVTTASNHTLYAHWTAKTYTVTFDRQGATNGSASVTATFDSVMPTSGISTPTRTGYTFEGYYDATSGGTQYYTSAGASAKTWDKASNTTLYAHWKVITYTISYDLKGGSVATANPATYNIETATFTLNKPTRTGYTFAGWTGTGLSSATVTVSVAKGSTGNRSYVATWTANPYTVTLDRQSGTTGSTSVTATYDSAMPAMTKPTRSGYTFGGYYTATNGGGTQYYKEDGASARTWNIANSTTTLYAKWTANTYTVTFNKNSGSGGSDSVTATYDAAMPTSGLSKPSRTGYTFKGYYDGTGGTGTQYYTENLTSARTWNKAAATTLYAKWEIVTYNITYTLNSGTVSTANLSTYNVETTAFTLNNPTRTGYTFKGWSGTGLTGTENKTVTIAKGSTGNRTYTANWTVNTYTVTLNNQSATTAGTTSVTATYGSSMPTITVPTRTGYTFGGYYTSTGGSGTQYYNASGGSAKNWDLTSATTLYAKWIANTYTVSFSQSNNSGGQTANVTATYGSAMPTISAVPTRTGYEFQGYYDASSGGTKYYNADKSSAKNWDKTSATTLYAQWKGITYTVNFHPQNGSNSGSAMGVSYGNPIANVTPPTRTGYTFTGYWDATSGGIKYCNADGTSARNWDKASDGHLYGQWTANTYTVTLNRESGSGGTSSVTATYDSAMPSASMPTRSGYAFGGYYTGTDGSGTKYYNADGTSAKIWDLTSNTTLYAKWTKMITVTFNANGSTISGGVSSIMREPGAQYGTLPTCTHNTVDANFIGWSLSSTSRDFISSTSTIPSNQTSNINLYAVYDYITFMFYSDNIVDIQYGTTNKHSTSSATLNGYLEIKSNYTYATVSSSVSNYAKAATKAVIKDNIKPKSTNSWFSKFTKLTTIQDINKLNTANVTDMSAMFDGCSGLTTLDVSKFNTANVKYMGDMFRNCSKLTALDVSKFNTANITEMYGMFWGCSGLTSLNVSNFDTTNVKSMNGMFYGCSGLTTLDVSHFDTTKVTSMLSMFSDCSGLTVLDVSKFDTANATNMAGMFNGCSGLTTLDVSHFDTTKVTSMDSMFSDCSGLTVLDVSKFDTANVTGMAGMFDGCSGLTTLDVSHFDTANVKDMYWTFLGCSGLTTLDVSHWNTTNVTSMFNMFNGCSGLTTLDVSNFDTANVKNIFNMFSGCSGLTTLDVSHFDTANVTRMDGMFSGCSGLTTLDVSHFDTTKVTSIYDMFYGCSGLTTLDVSHFDTANVTSMSGMFRGCSGLTTLDVSHFDTSNVTGMYDMFEDCSGLTALDVSNFDTTKVKNMEEMFSHCSGLTTLDLSSFDTVNVTSMLSMFYGCSGLTTLDLSSFDTAKVVDIRTMFYDCSRLTHIYASASFVTTSVTYYSYMFWNCNNLVGGNGTTWNSSMASDKTYARIDGGVSAPGLFTRKT